MIPEMSEFCFYTPTETGTTAQKTKRDELVYRFLATPKNQQLPERHYQAFP